MTVVAQYPEYDDYAIGDQGGLIYCLLPFRSNSKGETQIVEQEPDNFTFLKVFQLQNIILIETN